MVHSSRPHLDSVPDPPVLREEPLAIKRATRIIAHTTNPLAMTTNTYRPIELRDTRNRPFPQSPRTTRTNTQEDRGLDTG